jgi:hypothetical protein
MFKINSNFTKFFVLLIGISLLLVIPLSSAMAASSPGEVPKFNLIEFLKAAGIIFTPMLAIVFGLVDYLGKLGVKGIWQLISSMLSGLILGGIVMYFTIYPDTAVGWFSVALFGLLIGLAASGCYQGIKTASAKGAGEKIDLDERLPK